MIIRGLDFARHSVILGGGGDNPAPSGPQANVPKGELTARVLSVAGSEATLEMNGQRVVVETHIPLNTGDKLYVQVQQGAGGTLRLSVLASGPEGEVLPTLPQADLDALLRDLGLPTDERHRHAARALLARDGTIERPALNRLMSDLRQFPAVTPREAGAAALLEKAGVAVTPATVALVAQRDQPNAPPRLASALAPLAAGLEALKRQLPPRSPQAALVNELLTTLSGIPLDERSSPPRVEQSLRQWMAKLQPHQEARGTAAPTDPRMASPFLPAPQSGAAPEAPPAFVTTIMSALSPKEAPQAPGAAPEAQAPPSPVKSQEGEAAALPEGPKQAPERSERVSTSQQFAEKMGITAKVQPSIERDLATLLERLDKGLGTENQGLKKLVHEAIAEVRYTQLVNGPLPQAPLEAMEYLVPLLLPQLSQEHPEGRIQVFHRQAKPGEAIDPNNVRLVFILETDHLGNVQTDMTIKEGVVDVTVGVPSKENRDFLVKHLEELERAIADHGWSTGRFSAQVAKRQPPKTRQEEGLAEIVRFDRRV